MCEGFAVCALAFVLLAAASHRFHRDAGATAPAQRRWLRGLGMALLAAVAVVLTLSVRAAAVLYPLRRLLTRRAAAPAGREVEALVAARG
jgi:hypothetical protein